MIWWNGVSSDDLHLYVERYPSRKLPVRKTTFYSVPGRTGDYVYQQNAWENYTQAYDIYISAEDRKLPNAMTAITAWLYSANGYAKLEDSYDLDTYRMAVFEGGQDIENYLNRYGKATIEFNCKPQRWLVSGNDWIDFTSGTYNNPVITFNPTGMPSTPVLKFTASGEIGFDARSLHESDGIYLSNATGIMEIDCETFEVSVSGAIDPFAENNVDNMSMKIPGVIGEIMLYCHNWGSAFSVASAMIKPRWFSL